MVIIGCRRAGVGWLKARDMDEEEEGPNMEVACMAGATVAIVTATFARAIEAVRREDVLVAGVTTVFPIQEEAAGAEGGDIMVVLVLLAVRVSFPNRDRVALVVLLESVSGIICFEELAGDDDDVEMAAVLVGCGTVIIVVVAPPNAVVELVLVEVPVGEEKGPPAAKSERAIPAAAAEADDSIDAGDS